MLRFFRQDNPFALLVVMIGTLLLRVGMMAHGRMPPANAAAPLFNEVVAMLKPVLGKGFGWNVAAFLVLLGQAVYFNGMLSRHRLLSKGGYLPALAYGCLSALHPALNVFSAPLLACWCTLGMLDYLLGLQQPQSPRKQIFNAAFLAAAALLLYLPAGVLCLWLLVSLLVIRAFHAGEWVVALLGLLTPPYFLSALLFIADRPSLAQVFRGLRLIPMPAVKHPVYLFGTLIAVGLLILNGLAGLQRQLQTTSISHRRSWLSVSIGLPLAVGAAIPGMRLTGPDALLLALPFVALVAVVPMGGDKLSRFGTFAFWLLLAVAIFAQSVLYLPHSTP